VRIDTSPEEKLRRDELIPFLYFAEHEKLPASTPFRKPRREEGVDLEYALGDSIAKLQITTAYPVWFDADGEALNGGHQYRLYLDKNTADGCLSGSGPFERQSDKITNNECCGSG
jgi:hypothetical protein